MITEEYNKGVSFRITAIGFSTLCHIVESVLGVVFTKRQRFFWSIEDVSAEFTFQGHSFTISTDGWDGALWIITKDGQHHPDEIQILREHVEQRARASWVWRLLSWRFT